MINPSEKVQFDVDAMLMYGWVADKEQQITHLSRSLQRWLEDFKWIPELGTLLLTYSSGGHISVAELHRAILHDEREKETADIVEASLGDLSDFVERISLTVPPNIEDFQRGEYTVRRLYRRGSRSGEPPLAGMRFLREGATLMRSGQNKDRVDMVAVALIQKAGAWRVAGYQGQLQEAWLRARSKLYDGFHSAGIALMARNLSHNIGSHALFWMRKEATERSVGNANGDSEHAIFDESRARFYDYLQARMELLAGFATHMPLSPTTVTVGELLETFGHTTLLRENIARSESVKSVQIVPNILGNCGIGLPGGEVGAHAFYSILENCIRDSSKYARRTTPNSLTMNVRARVYDDRFIEVDVFDDARNYDSTDGTDGAGRTLAEKVRTLRLVDDGGTLMLHEWGVKERFICAALLRGARPENFVPEEDESFEKSSLSSEVRDGPPILQIVNVCGCIAWRFYLNRPGADVLLVTDRPADYPQYQGDRQDVEVRTPGQLTDNLRVAGFVRSRFVVLDSIPTLTDASLAAALPNRLFVSKERLRSATTLHSCAVDVAADLNAADLQRLTVEALLARRSEQLPVLTIASGAGEPLRALIPGLSTEAVDEKRLLSSIPHNKPRAIFQRHDRHVKQLEGVPLTFDALKQQGVVFYEQRYTDSMAMDALLKELQRGSAFAAYRLLEAAVTRVLIADERLDLATTSEEKEALAFRGIEVTGGAFSSGEGPVTSESLRERVTSLIQTAMPKDFAVVHLGIIDKIVKGAGKWTPENLCAAMEAKGAKVVIHSGRMDMSSMPRHVKFLSLTNVTRWITSDLAKFQIVDELNALRRI